MRTDDPLCEMISLKAQWSHPSSSKYCRTFTGESTACIFHGSWLKGWVWKINKWNRCSSQGACWELHTNSQRSSCTQQVRFDRKNSISSKDLKPSNILLTLDGTPKITDFGLARAHNYIAEQSDNDVRYSSMSPEQIEGMDLNIQSDLFSVGLLMYEMMSENVFFRITRCFHVKIAISRPP